MSTDRAETELDDERTKWTPWAIAAAILLLLLFGVIAVTTVRGCFYVSPEEAAKLDEDKKKEEEKKKEARFRSGPTRGTAHRVGNWHSTGQAGTLGGH